MDIELHVAHDDHAPLAAGDLHRVVDDLGRVGARAHDGGVDALLAGEVEDPALELGVARVHHERRVRFLRERVRPRVHIDPHDHAAGGERDAHGQLADQPEAVDRDDFSELEIRASECLHRDAADGHERGVAQVDVVRDVHDVVEVRRRELRVAGRRVGHGLADLEPFDVLAEREHRARTAVPDLARRDHLVPDPPRRLGHAGRKHGLLDRVTHPWIREGLLGQLDRRLRQRAHLGARADERIAVVHEDLVRPHVRLGQVDDHHVAASIDHTTEDLFHALESLESWSGASSGSPATRDRRCLVVSRVGRTDPRAARWRGAGTPRRA